MKYLNPTEQHHNNYFWYNNINISLSTYAGTHYLKFNKSTSASNILSGFGTDFSE